MARHRINAPVVVLAAIPFVAIIALLMAALFVGGSAGGTLSTGRSVMAYSDSIALSMTSVSDTATIHTGGKTIVVRPTCLIVDGTTIANIKEDVRDVQVHVKRGAITFVADGNPVPTK